MSISDIGKYLVVLAIAVVLLYHFGFMGLIGAVAAGHMALSENDRAHWWHLPS